MILDNQNKNPKVYEWIQDYTQNGDFDIVTGYFTIGALAFLSEKTNEAIEKYRFIIGDIVSNTEQKTKTLDLLNENLSAEGAFQLKRWALEAKAFLDQNKVECKTLEPNFCHAKLYLTKSKNNKPIQEMYIMGSSNLTEAGIGLKPNQNVELNTAGTGAESTFTELKSWFEELWHKDQARNEKTIIALDGKTKKVNFKQYLIDEISKIFHLYEPNDIYQKILFELFNLDEDPDFQKDMGKLETSTIFKKLFPFQRQAAINLIKILNKFNGAILADAVGLGKTWTTLAIIKHFQTKGRTTILLCPKKLEQNWKQFKRRQNSIFENDDFDYEMNFHTDFTENNLEGGKINFEFINNDKPKLIVIDESHNLRNDKSIKYQILMDEILKKTKGDIKVLLLSATPINNNFKDIRNQFALMTKGNNRGFEELLDVKSLDSTFRHVQSNFNKWAKDKTQNLTEFYHKVHQSDFFKLTESLVVARTRKNILNHFDKDFHFPKVAKPRNVFKTPLQMGDFEDFPDLMEKLKLNLSAYQPSQFTLSHEEIEAIRIEKASKQKKQKDAVLTDNLQREYFLVKMMKILMLKRLESSWKAFQNTVNNIYAHHEGALAKVKDYQRTKRELNLDDDQDLELAEDEDLIMKLEGLKLGKKNPISIRTIDQAGRLEDFKNAVKKDKENLLIIQNNIREFQDEFELNHTSDIKLQELIATISKKQKGENKKVIIFTAYKDTAEYLYKELQNQNLKNLGLVYGDQARASFSDKKMKIQTLLQHFAPYTKLFLEKRWDKFALEKNKENFGLWQNWLSENDDKTAKIIEKPIDILISTDVLSEGQNLQDADMLINYDIHWNPVRVIQRFGRIDRIGSPNNEIKCVNFWPAESINDYIKLKGRVEARMAVMQFVGSEVIKDFTDEFAEMSQNPIEDIQNENLLRQMESSISELDGESSMGFDDFSFDVFKQQLQDMMAEKSKELENLPNGIFSGFKLETNDKGLIALLGVLPKKEGQYQNHKLVHLDSDGNLISDNIKVVLEFLSVHRNAIRTVDAAIDKGDAAAIQNLQKCMEKWISSQNSQTVENEDGSTTEIAGQNQINALDALRKGNMSTIKTASTLNKKYDLITWMIVS